MDTILADISRLFGQNSTTMENMRELTTGLTFLLLGAVLVLAVMILGYAIDRALLKWKKREDTGAKGGQERAGEKVNREKSSSDG